MTTTTTELLISPFRKDETPLSATADKDARTMSRATHHICARDGNIYATNGRILAVYPDRVNSGAAHEEAVLPREVVQAATKGAQRAAIEVEGDSATSHTRAGTISGSLVEGDFPQCKAVIDGLKEAEHEVYLDGDQLIALLKAIGGVKGRVVKLRLPKDATRPFRVETDDAWGVMMPMHKEQ
jgi:DNA polymerase III sliding clamp (beta) subunit (PCNA family)